MHKLQALGRADSLTAKFVENQTFNFGTFNPGSELGDKMGAQIIAVHKALHAYFLTVNDNDD